MDVIHLGWKMDLYTPVLEPQRVLAMVHAGERENHHLDFKQAWWPRRRGSPCHHQEEAAKDVAAFLNTMGGTILLGVTERNDRATGLIQGNWDDATLRNWLRDRLAPASAETHVRCVHIDVPWQGDTITVLAVNVDPWPHGPVGVRHGTDRAIPAYRFWYRRGSENRSMEWEVCMAMFSEASRRPFLLAAALDLVGTEIFVTSPVRAHHQGHYAAVVLDGRNGAGHATVRSIDNTVMSLEMSTACKRAAGVAQTIAKAEHLEYIGSDAARNKARSMRNNPHKFAKAALAAAEHGAPQVPIPWDLVDTIWPHETTSGRVVQVMLRAPLVWGDPYWRLGH